MTVKCYTGNQREEARVKYELGNLHTNLGRLRSKGEILEACTVFEDAMDRLDIPLTPEVKQLSNEKRSGPFKTRLYDIRAQNRKRKAFDAKQRVKLPSWARSWKRNRKQKIPPKKDEKMKQTPPMKKTKEDAADGEDERDAGVGGHQLQVKAPTTTPKGFVGRSTKKNRKQKIPPKKEDADGEGEGNVGVGGHAGALKEQEWRKPETDGVKAVVTINLPPSMEATVSQENPKAGETEVKSGTTIHITIKEKAAEANQENAEASDGGEPGEDDGDV